MKDNREGGRKKSLLETLFSTKSNSQKEISNTDHAAADDYEEISPSLIGTQHHISFFQIFHFVPLRLLIYSAVGRKLQ